MFFLARFGCRRKQQSRTQLKCHCVYAYARGARQPTRTPLGRASHQSTDLVAVEPATNAHAECSRLDLACTVGASLPSKAPFLASKPRGLHCREKPTRPEGPLGGPAYAAAASPDETRDHENGCILNSWRNGGVRWRQSQSHKPTDQPTACPICPAPYGHLERARACFRRRVGQGGVERRMLSARGSKSQLLTKVGFRIEQMGISPGGPPERGKRRWQNRDY